MSTSVLVFFVFIPSYICLASLINISFLPSSFSLYIFLSISSNSFGFASSSITALSLRSKFFIAAITSPPTGTFHSNPSIVGFFWYYFHFLSCSCQSISNLSYVISLNVSSTIWLSNTSAISGSVKFLLQISSYISKRYFSINSPLYPAF